MIWNNPQRKVTCYIFIYLIQTFFSPEKDYILSHKDDVSINFKMFTYDKS